MRGEHPHVDVQGWCLDCGLQHNQQTRLRVLRRMLPATSDEISNAWPCFWRTFSLGRVYPSNQLYRDLRALGAVNINAASPAGWRERIWGLPK